LFGTANYSFELDPKEPTLLTGVNGTGKSTILRSIDAVSTGNWSLLLEIPFSSLKLGFESGREISIARGKETIRIGFTGEETWNLDYSADIDREWEHLREIERDMLLHEQLMSERDRRDAIERVMAQRAHLDHIQSLRARMHHGRISGPDWAAHLPEIFPVLFITDQRLIIDSPRRSDRERTADKVSTRTAADEASRHIAREISIAKANYANRSQALDRDFPQRVIKAIAHPPRVSDEQLRGRLDALTHQREALEFVGLVPTEPATEFEGLDLAPTNVRSVINIYTDDTKRKLEVLEPLRLKLQLFSDFLNQHYGQKRITIDPEYGFTVSVSSQKTSTLPPSKLSSGEQQIMVLAHQILFRAKPGTLVLIDEPELSLHVLWQASFVEDLAQMGKVNSLSFLLATHSPTLIGGREDLKRSLDVINGA